MSTLLGIVISVLPVFLFLGALVVIDSYKLLSVRAVLVAVGAGVAAAVASYAVNVELRPALGLEFLPYARYVAPVIEEGLKATFIIYLLSRSKIGFVVDAAIYGFAVGTGFAFVENLYYLIVNPDAVVWNWVVRGFGTAVMHGGATAIFAMGARALHARVRGLNAPLLLPGFATAVMLHSLYNHFLLQPLIATGLILLVCPWVAVAIFQHSERDTRTWLGTGFDTDQELLRAVRTGTVSTTPVGTYLTTVREHFQPEVIVDMLCLLRLRAELGIRAKGVLLAREAGFETDPDPTLHDKFTELRYLERSIGKTGMRALQPFIHTSTQDLWQLNMLDEAKG